MEPITTATLGKLILGGIVGFFVKEVLDGNGNKTDHSYDSTEQEREDYNHRRDYEGNYPDWNG